MDLVHENAKTAVHDLMDRLRIEVLKHGCGVRNIREEDSYYFPLSLDGAAIGENLFGKMLWGVRMRLVVIQGLGLLGLAEIVAALTAELAAR
jgi:hypothetical protein